MARGNNMSHQYLVDENRELRRSNTAKQKAYDMAVDELMKEKEVSAQLLTENMELKYKLAMITGGGKE